MMISVLRHPDEDDPLAGLSTTVHTELNGVHTVCLHFSLGEGLTQAISVPNSLLAICPVL